MLDIANRMLIAKSGETDLVLLSSMANRHGLITGATGTGKTVSMQVVAESLSALGVPVFITDIKGDVAGIGMPGGSSAAVDQRVENLHLTGNGFVFQGSPVCFWDIFGQRGHPLRTTISEMGPMLLGRILDLNDTQSNVLQMLFRLADDGGLLLLDLKDLRKLTEYVAANRKEFTAAYGNLSTSTLGAIQRGLLTLDQQGGEVFFGEPALDYTDLLRRVQGKGVVNLLAADRLLQAPRLYAAFMLWLLSELFENLPEAGDVELPKLVLFFDEAHLLFANAPKVLVERIEQVVRLIRSKGVGVFFITQNPSDIPATVLSQLGNRLQHALRAYTPGERKAVKAAADAFRANPAFKTGDAITSLAVGEALVSFLDDKGVPAMVERATVLPPESRIGPMTDVERQIVVQKSPMYGRYERSVDRESAYEILSRRVLEKTPQDDGASSGAKKAKGKAKDENVLGDLISDFARKTQQSVTRNLANQVGRSLIRGVLGGLFGGKK